MEWEPPPLPHHSGQDVSSPPLITIGITCFNAEDTILRAIRSAQKQDWPNFEIVVVDDTSTDKSTSIIEEIQKEDWRISLHHHGENRGVAAARNTIIQKAKGEYIAFFDDDDESLPERLSKQYQRLSQFQEKHLGVPVLCYCHYIHIKHGEKERIFMAPGYRSPEPHGEMVLDFLLWNKKQWKYTLQPTFGAGVTMASRVLLQKFSYDPQFRRVEDWDIAIRTAMARGYFISVDESLVNQYVTEAADKGGCIELKHLLMLVKKNKTYLQKRRMYWTALLHMHARFYYDFKKNNPLKRYLFLFLASVFSPKKFFFDKVAAKITKSS